ncbi:hypothetical protein V1514DRAFT_347174 [Lipomyces japonicus]|uniref:uncharacterized protein n=1 Tax=Lipomyces japonicus TaxID=56871 RepID=UPI0034CEE989
MLSSNLPMTAGGLGPISNLFSVVALVEGWIAEVVTENLGQQETILTHHDRPSTIALNAVSLAFGVTANLSLLMNFTGRIRYNYSQAISISCFYIASIILIVITAKEKAGSFDSMVEKGLQVYFTQAYWSAIITAAMYFMCGVCLTWNEIGHLLKLYPASFILTGPQRSFMLQTLGIVIWLAGGAGMFARIEGWTYANALYYCDVTVLTIGFGDFVPTQALGRALVMPYALIGLLFVGLVVASVRTLMLSATREKQSVNTAERMRRHKVKSVKGKTLSGEDSFNLMRKIHRRAKRRGMWVLLAFTAIIFFLFWLVGALIFSSLEGWTYLEGVYFCSLCLFTIGYGDFVPTKPGSKAFFVAWSLLAVPMMTILISSLGDTIIAGVMIFTDVLGDLTLKNITTISRPTPDVDFLNLSYHKVISEMESQNTMADSLTVQETDQEFDRDLEQEIYLVDAIQSVLYDMRFHKSKKYSYEEWNRLEHDLDTQFDWLGQASPIRFPVNEPTMLLRLYWGSLKEHLDARQRKYSKVR